jgi:hypothetical protein
MLKLTLEAIWDFSEYFVVSVLQTRMDSFLRPLMYL